MSNVFILPRLLQLITGHFGDLIIDLSNMVREPGHTKELKEDILLVWYHTDLFALVGNLPPALIDLFQGLGLFMFHLGIILSQIFERISRLFNISFRFLGHAALAQRSGDA